MAGGGEGAGLGRFFDMHPSFGGKPDEDSIAPKYDSKAEPEAKGRPYEQSMAILNAEGHYPDFPGEISQRTFAPVKFNHDDLLSAAPKSSDVTARIES